eukprot:11958865-Ditylum_brightwellii.AAC.2
MTPEEHDLIFNSFGELFQEMYKNRHVEESSYDHLGLPPDFEEGEDGDSSRLYSRKVSQKKN